MYARIMEEAEEMRDRLRKLTSESVNENENENEDRSSEISVLDPYFSEPAASHERRSRTAEFNASTLESYTPKTESSSLEKNNMRRDTNHSSSRSEGVVDCTRMRHEQQYQPNEPLLEIAPDANSPTTRHHESFRPSSDWRVDQNQDLLELASSPDDWNTGKAPPRRHSSPNTRQRLRKDPREVQMNNEHDLMPSEIHYDAEHSSAVHSFKDSSNPTRPRVERGVECSSLSQRDHFTAMKRGAERPTKAKNTLSSLGIERLTPELSQGNNSSSFRYISGSLPSPTSSSSRLQRQIAQLANSRCSNPTDISAGAQKSVSTSKYYHNNARKSKLPEPSRSITSYTTPTGLAPVVQPQQSSVQDKLSYLPLPGKEPPIRTRSDPDEKRLNTEVSDTQKLSTSTGTEWHGRSRHSISPA